MGHRVRILTVFGIALGLAILTAPMSSPALAQDSRIDGFSTWSPEDRSSRDYYDPRYGYRDYPGDYDDRYRRKRRWEREYIKRPEILKPAKRPKNQKWRRAKKANFSITTVNPHIGKDGKGVYRTIRDAVDHTRPGGTVLIMPGVYGESLLLTWPVYLRADVREESGLDSRREAVVIRPPAGQPCAAVAVMDNELVKIRDLSFEAPSSRGAEGCVIHRNGALIMQDSFITGSQNGAAVFLAGGSAILDNNFIEMGRIGVYVGPKAVDSRGLRTYQLMGNTIQENSIGVNVDAFDAKVVLQENTVLENGEAGMIVSKGSVEARRNSFNMNEDDGVVVLYPDEVDLRENVLFSNGRYGIYMPLSDRVSLNNNIIMCNSSAGVARSDLLEDYDRDEDLDEIAEEKFPGNEIQYNPPNKRFKRGFFSRLRRSGDLTPEEMCMEPPYRPFDRSSSYDDYDDYDSDDRYSYAR